jgi:hypothetical protein
MLSSPGLSPQPFIMANLAALPSATRGRTVPATEAHKGTAASAEPGELGPGLYQGAQTLLNATTRKLRLRAHTRRQEQSGCKNFQVMPEGRASLWDFISAEGGAVLPWG